MEANMQPAMAYTYVPVPVYNMAGMTVASPAGMAAAGGMPTITSPVMTSLPAAQQKPTSKMATRTRSRNEEASKGQDEGTHTLDHFEFLAGFL